MTLRDLSTLVLTATIAMAISYVTLSPPSGLPSVPGSDKTHHILAFALLALPSAAFSPRLLLLVLPLAALFGAGIELVQPLVGRSAELADWLADMAGLGLGAMAGLVLSQGARRLAMR